MSATQKATSRPAWRVQELRAANNQFPNSVLRWAVWIGVVAAPGVDYSDLEAFGEHTIQNNTIRQCGQAGIAGQKGATRSLISGNLIRGYDLRAQPVRGLRL